MRYLPPVNTKPMPLHNLYQPASVAAAKFRASHGTMQFTACPDSACITHWSSHSHSRWWPKDRSCVYGKEQGHITSYCALKRWNMQYQQAVLGTKTAAEILHTMAQTNMENSVPATARKSQTPTTTPTPSSQHLHLHTTSMEATD